MPFDTYAPRQLAESAAGTPKTVNSNKSSNTITNVSLNSMVLRADVLQQGARMQTLLAAQQKLQQSHARGKWAFPSPQPKSSSVAPKLADVIFATENFSDFLHIDDAIKLAAALPQASSTLLTQRAWRRSVATLLQVDESRLRQKAIIVESISPIYRTNWQQLRRAIAKNPQMTAANFSLDTFDESTIFAMMRLVPEVALEQYSNDMERLILRQNTLRLLPHMAADFTNLSSHLFQLFTYGRFVLLGATLSDQAFIATVTQPLLKIEFLQKVNEWTTTALLQYMTPKTYRWGMMAICSTAAMGCLVNAYTTSNHLALVGHEIKNGYTRFQDQINLNALQAVVQSTKPISDDVIIL